MPPRTGLGGQMGPGFYKDAAPTALDPAPHFVLRWQAERDTAFVRTRGFRTFGAAPRARKRRRRCALPAQYKPGSGPDGRGVLSSLRDLRGWGGG